MTNQQALKLIKQTKYCYVVWSTLDNAIVGVHPVPEHPSPEDLAAVLTTVPKIVGRTKGRFLDPKVVTLQMLEEEQAETKRVDDRVRAFQRLRRMPTDDLVRILADGALPQPLDAFHGNMVLLEELAYSPDHELTLGRLAELERVAAQRADQLEPIVLNRLHCLLCVAVGDGARLLRVGQDIRARRLPWAAWFDYATAAGDLGIAAAEVLDDLVRTIASPGMFEPKLIALRALGKIGARAGEPAAAAIAEHIYDSSPDVASLRARVIERIHTSESEWQRCGTCRRGKVRRMSGDGTLSFELCAACSGLARVKLVQSG